MRLSRSTKTVAVPKSLLTLEGGVVILFLKDYRQLLENTVPAVYLRGRKARALDRLVEEGLQQHFEGKTRKINSLADLD
jgi:hypothetical protein